ncbi:hypothetical protein [Methylobacterium fujisawaense]
MQTDEQIIADLSASLRLALLYLETFGIVIRDGAPGFAPVIYRGGEDPQPFDADGARRILAGADARLSTAQPKQQDGERPL